MIPYPIFHVCFYYFISLFTPKLFVQSNEEESEGEELDEHGKDQSCNGAPPNPHSTPNKRKRDEEGNINGKSNESSRPLNTTSG